MPHCQDDPFPKYFEIEVDALLAGFVYQWVFVDELIIHVLKKVFIKN
jgi:hypothetical protein